MAATNSIRLTANCVPLTELSERDVRAMFQIHAAHYDSDEAIFRADLAKKSWIIQIFDEEQTLRGFSTLVVWHHDFGAGGINVLFSGDTIIDQRYWGHRALHDKWLEVTGALHARHPGTPLYWLLTSMHPRTYRILPILYRRFYPSWHGEDAELQAIATSVARARFGAEFDATRGVIVGEAPLKESVATVSSEKMSRTDVRFFLERNPGYASGDELVCLVPIDEANHRPMSRRFFLRGAETGLTDRPQHLGAAA